jgi:hypothetical protein
LEAQADTESEGEREPIRCATCRKTFDFSPENGTNRHNPAPSGTGSDQQRVKGVEPDPNPLVSIENKHTSDAGAAKASVAGSSPVSADPHLHAVIDAWTDLPAA